MIGKKYTQNRYHTYHMRHLCDVTFKNDNVIYGAVCHTTLIPCDICNQLKNNRKCAMSHGWCDTCDIFQGLFSTPWLNYSRGRQWVAG